MEDNCINITKPREAVIESFVDILRHTPFTVQFKVVKNPKGIKIIHEVTKEELDAVMNKAMEEEEKAQQSKMTQSQ